MFFNSANRISTRHFFGSIFFTHLFSNFNTKLVGPKTFVDKKLCWVKEILNEEFASLVLNKKFSYFQIKVNPAELNLSFESNCLGMFSLLHKDCFVFFLINKNEES